MTNDDRIEWLEADGLGGFASGTATGVRTRRYHALLLVATTPPTGRMVLVNGCDAFLTTPGGRWALSSQAYGPDVVHPDGAQRLVSFSGEPWPTWEYATEDGYRIRQEILAEHGRSTTLVAWTLLEGQGPAILEVRPFFSGRDYHSTHHENGAFGFIPKDQGSTRVWQPYSGGPAVAVTTNSAYGHSPEWYRNFLYAAERERGLDHHEDLASPGVFTWRLMPGCEAAMVLSATLPDAPTNERHALERARVIRTVERARRLAFPTLLDCAAAAYLVRRGEGRSLVAGYPWFTDWGRDTFIAIRGLCIAAGRLREARDILLEWSGAISRGMLPNRFPDAGESPEFNSVDASLWFIVAVHELLTADGASDVVGDEHRRRLQDAIIHIVGGYASGTRFGIRSDTDGLLAAGEPGIQLTWMDARVGDRVITPRIGKPVEVQALWINALHVASVIDDRWSSTLATARQSFAVRFWNDERSCLYDVVDVDHIPGVCDPAIRPNQILAVGGLPFSVLDDGRKARLVVDVVERELLTPIGLRSLAPTEPGYAARYEGGPAERDAIYHQGIVWPWLLGPFVEAWVRVRRNTDAARRRARRQFLGPVLEQMTGRGLGHLSEIADATPPFTPRGCPFQAWSVGEVLRVFRLLTPIEPRTAKEKRSPVNGAPAQSL